MSRIIHHFTYGCLLLFGLCHFARSYPNFQQENAREILRIAKSAEMRSYMSPEIDACQDFYQYACGNWAKVNPASFGVGKTGTFKTLEKAYNRRVSRLLQTPKSSNESDMDRHVKYFFDSCLDRMASGRNYREKLMGIMEEFGGMPAFKGDKWQADKFDWVEVVAQILRKYGKQILIGVNVFADLTNNKVNRLYLGQIDDLVSSRASEYYIRLKSVRKIELQQILGLSEELAEKTAGDMVNFERKLASGVIDQHEGLGMVDKTRLRLLEEMTESYKPTLNFTQFVNVWLGSPYLVPVYEYVESYIQKLCKLIENTPKQVVANYIMWELVEEFHMPPERNESKQMEKCVDKTKRFFIKYLDNLVYRELMKNNQQVIGDVADMWNELKNAFMRILQSKTSRWMTDNTRTKALEKLLAMSLEINSYENEDFGKEYGHLVISADNYFENVVNILWLRGRNFLNQINEPPKLEESQTLTYTPAYAAEYNKVLIPVAFLQPRFLWDDAYPVALKFSTVGYIIAHEMAHGFDDIVRKYDAKGNVDNWWDKKSTEAFGERKECIKEQYSKYRYGFYKVPKANAQDENIADNVGVRIAFEAYKKWLDVNVKDKALPRMDFTPRQLFFIGVAQVWCTDVYALWQHLVLITDVHAPEEVRVKAMLSNYEDFSAEFMCRNGTQMNPVHKCVFY